MTETLQPMADEVDPQHLAEQLLAQAKAQGVDLERVPWIMTAGIR
jgi:hypothetical protein